MTVSKPQVITKMIDGQKHEPVERSYVETPEEFSGLVIEELSKRKGELQKLETNENSITSMEFLIPTRGIMGYRNEFLTTTRGLGILTSLFECFQPWKGNIPKRTKGVLISINTGKATTYAIGSLQKRGTLFVSPGDEVYEGMIIGENSRDQDLIVNITKAKQLTNVRAAGSDENVLVIPARKMSLEQGIVYIEDDELIEITPRFIRLRKKQMKEVDRKKAVVDDD
jgi:GTP-binding protein